MSEFLPTAVAFSVADALYHFTGEEKKVTRRGEHLTVRDTLEIVRRYRIWMRGANYDLSKVRYGCDAEPDSLLWLSTAGLAMDWLAALDVRASSTINEYFDALDKQAMLTAQIKAEAHSRVCAPRYSSAPTECDHAIDALVRERDAARALTNRLRGRRAFVRGVDLLADKFWHMAASDVRRGISPPFWKVYPEAS